MVRFMLKYIDNRFFRIRWRLIIKKLFSIFLGLIRGLVVLIGGKKWKKSRYHYLITLENFKKEAAEIVLQDRIPVSTMKEVKVEKVDISLKPDESRDDGIVTWNLKPAAGGKVEIRISYTIAFPGDWPEHSLNLE